MVGPTEQLTQNERLERLIGNMVPNDTTQGQAWIDALENTAPDGDVHEPSDWRTVNFARFEEGLQLLHQYNSVTVEQLDHLMQMVGEECEALIDRSGIQRDIGSRIDDLQTAGTIAAGLIRLAVLANNINEELVTRVNTDILNQAWSPDSGV